MPKPTDDRGNACAIARLSLYQVLLRTMPTKRWIRDELVLHERSAFGAREYTVAILLAIPFFFLMVFVLRRSSNYGFMGFVEIAAYVSLFSFMMTLGIWAFQSWTRTPKFPKIATMMLSRSQCPACNYTLVGLPTEPDNCIICPECSAAWHAERIGRANRRDTLDHAEEIPSH